MLLFLFSNISPLKAQLLPILKKFFGSDSAKSVLDYARSELQKAWVESPASNANGMIADRAADAGIAVPKPSSTQEEDEDGDMVIVRSPADVPIIHIDENM